MGQDLSLTGKGKPMEKFIKQLEAAKKDPHGGKVLLDLITAEELLAALKRKT